MGLQLCRPFNSRPIHAVLWVLELCRISASLSVWKVHMQRGGDSFATVLMILPRLIQSYNRGKPASVNGKVGGADQGNLWGKKKTAVMRGKARHPVCPTNSSSHAVWKWMVVIKWHVFVSLHYCVVVITVSGNLHWKITLMVSPPNKEFVNFPPENSIPPHEWESDRVLFTDGD